jgi:flagellin-like protein
MNLSHLRKMRKRGVSEIIGAVILFGMIIAVAFGFFYILAQDQNVYQQASLQANNSIAQQNLERLAVYGYSAGNVLGFYVNNTGIATSIVAFWILNQTGGGLLQYKNITTLSGTLPQYIAPGLSWTYSSTGISLTNPNQKYVIKVLTAKGTSAIGTYPSTQLTSAAVNSLVAGGFGSLQMQFSSFTWYDYKSGPPNQVQLTQNGGGFCGFGYSCGTCQYSTCNYYFTNLCIKGQQCNGGSWAVDLAHPYQGSRIPEGFENSCSLSGQWWSQTQTCYFDEIPTIFSVNITNDDPGLSTIVLNSASNLWVIETCDSGVTEGNCPSGNPVFVFYLMNVNQTSGAITSVNKGSFSQIQIPYGATKTLFYGSLYDLSLNSTNYVALTSATNQNPYYYGQFAVFLLFSGTKITQNSVLTYGQNIPFESTTVADNLGWYSETPTSTGSGATQTFSLQVNDSAFSYENSKINKVVVNASAFSSLSVVTTPSGWNPGTISGGQITWTSSGGIPWNSTATFKWQGKAPTVTGSVQEIIPVYIYWSSGVVTELEAAAVCTV